MPPWLAAGAVVFCLLAVMGGLALEFDNVIAPRGRPPIVLADRARAILTDLGYSPFEDEAWGYASNEAVRDRMRKHPAEIGVLVDCNI